MTHTDMSFELMSFELVCNNQNLLSEWFRGVGVSAQSFAQSWVHPCAPCVVFLQCACVCVCVVCFYTYQFHFINISHVEVARWFHKAA